MAAERIEERRVRRLLEGHAFDVERIEETPRGKRADFRVRREADVYVVEVKRIDEEPRTVAPGEVAHWDVPHGYRNALAGVVRDASAQLVATPVDESDPVRIAWFVATGSEADAYVDQLRATLYGAVDLIWKMGASGAIPKRCYFFTFAELRRRPEIDAVVIGTSHGGRFCVNPFGRRVEQVRRCALRLLFGQHVLDPEKEEASGTAFLADFSGDRSDEAATLEEVKRKYGLKFLIPFKPVKHIAIGYVEHDDSDAT